jgi:RNA polymerase sigma factor (sigma-70 family)
MPSMSRSHGAPIAAACPPGRAVAGRPGRAPDWPRLVARFDPGLRRIARSYRLCPADVDDVVQASWVRLWERYDSVRDPAALGGWLATTVRREAMALLQRKMREVPSDDPPVAEAPDPVDPAARLVQEERRSALHQAVAALPGRQRALLGVLVRDPEADYVTVARALSMPVGSIGPTRARSLERLRRSPALLAVAADGG